jgi:hypothetical protein
MVTGRSWSGERPSMRAADADAGVFEAAFDEGAVEGWRGVGEDPWVMSRA